MVAKTQRQTATPRPHYPYDTSQNPRRLDYVGVRGLFSISGQVGDVRDLARSDHEPVMLQLRGDPPKPKPTHNTCGPRHVHISNLKSSRNFWTSKQPTHRGTDMHKLHTSASSSPNRDALSMPGSQKAEPSNKHDGQRMQRSLGRGDDKHGRTSASSYMESRSSGRTA